MADQLINRIHAALASGEQYINSASLKQKKNALHKFSPHFAEAQRSLARTIELTKQLHKLKRPVACDLLEIEDALKTVRRDLEQDNFDPWNAEKLKNAVKKAEQDCRKEWDQYVHDRTGGTRKILQSIKNVVSEESEYLLLCQAESRISGSRPCSQEALAAIDDYLLHFRKLIEAIQLDEEVLAFLSEMTESGSVPLSHLSRSCLEKLQNQSFISKIKLVVR